MLEMAVTAALLLPMKADPVVTFATYNVCKTTCGTGRFAWENRKEATVRTILSAKPDILALQEADNSYPFFEDRLGRHGYARVEPDTDNCTGSCVPDSQLFFRTSTMAAVQVQVPSAPRPEPCLRYPPAGPEAPEYPVYPPQPSPNADPEQWRAWREELDRIDEQYGAANQVWREARADYNRSGCGEYASWTPFSTVGSESVALSQWGPAALTRSAQDRNITWALFRHRRSGAGFLAVSMHLPNEKLPATEKYRKYLAKSLKPRLQSWLGQLGAGSVPIVAMGDLNSFAYRQPKGAQWLLAKSGFKDAYSARRKVNGDVTTVNTSATNRDPFPPRPRRSDNPSRLDYVMFDKGRALRYEVHVRLNGGRFDNRFRGSDHNLVKATVRLPRVGLPAAFSNR
jgi:endonuclease/exonuclease/phosphatase family metal-dependent hydrolase